ncbi:hypothetical protein ACLB1O_14880 [Escherichia coli]
MLPTAVANSSLTAGDLIFSMVLICGPLFPVPGGRMLLNVELPSCLAESRWLSL